MSFQEKLQTVAQVDGIKRHELEQKIKGMKLYEPVEFTPIEAEFLNVVEDLELESLLDNEI